MAARALLFSGDQLWLRRRGEGAAECLFELPEEAWCERVDAGCGVGVSDVPPAPEAERVGVRAAFDWVSAEDFARVGLARQLLHWRRTHRYCGVCGAVLARHPTERAMRCAPCGEDSYPRINPVVIVRVTRGERVLLAHKSGGAFPFWSLVAGFVEAHETLEEAVAREVAEEVGVRVTAVRYAGSQAWPFPNNLMLGFTAEYAGGEIRPDGVEIEQAGWFGRDELPPLPSRFSIARRLIDAHFESATPAPAQG